MRKAELRRVVAEFRRGILDGRSSDRMCCMVCLPLQGYLSAACGIETKLVEVDFPTTDHVWLELPDGTIIDPTADQFSTKEQPLPAVYIGPLPPQYADWIAEEQRECEAVGIFRPSRAE